MGVVMMMVVIPSVIPSKTVPRVVPRTVPGAVPRVIPQAAHPESEPEIQHRRAPYIPCVGVICGWQDIDRRVETVQTLCVYAVVFLDQHHLGLVAYDLIGLVVEASGLGLQITDLGFLFFALGDRQTVVGAVKIVARRAGRIGAHTASGKCYGRYGRKDQLFHGCLFYMYNVPIVQNAHRAYTNVVKISKFVV